MLNKNGKLAFFFNFWEIVWKKGGRGWLS